MNVPEMQETLDEFLRRRFPLLKFWIPLFYEHPIALRFDLHDRRFKSQFDNHLIRARAVREAARRATRLFGASCDPTDEDWVVLLRYAEEREATTQSPALPFSEHSRLIFPVLNEPDCLARVCLPQLHRDDDLAGVRVSFPIRMNAFDHEMLFQSIANEDHALTPKFGYWWVYFVNATRGTIFHMYDDRGADVIASDQSTLRPLYVEFKDWLLDTERGQIDAAFST